MEAKTPAEKERALADMIMLSDAFKASCRSFAGAINYDEIIKRRGSDT